MPTPCLLVRALPLILVAMVPASTFGQAPPDSATDGEIARRIDDWVHPLEEARALSGTLLVGLDGDVVYERAFGMADFGDSIPNRATTLFTVASHTKPMTQVVLLRLVEEGRLDLADTVSTWLPDFAHGDRMTVEMLARHRSGIPHRVTTPEEETAPRTAADMVRLAGAHPLAFEPGEDELYSSAGYAVLARVLEAAAEKPYDELLEEYVFEPAGASRATDATRGRPADAAVGHFDAPGGPMPAPEKDLSFLVGAGSVYATPRDLFRIARALVDGTYGAELGERLVGEDGDLAWNGITNGNRAFLDYDHETGVTVVFAGNLFNGAIDLLRRAVPRIVAGETVEPPSIPRITPVPLSEATRRRYEGSYRLGSPLELEFVSPRLARLGEWLLVPTGETSFFSPQDYATVEVVLGEGGSVEALHWAPDEGPRFPRIDGS